MKTMEKIPTPAKFQNQKSANAIKYSENTTDNVAKCCFDFRNQVMAESKSPISILQELTEKEGKVVPKYTLEFDPSLPRSSPNLVNCSMKVEAFGITASSSGSSQKEAKHNAATEMLNKLAVVGLHVPPDIKSVTNVTELTTLCCKYKIPRPEYNVAADEGSWFTCECKILSHFYEGVGKTEEEAKEAAARKMLIKLNCAVEDIDCDSDEDELFPIDRLKIKNEKQFIVMLKAKMREKNVNFADWWEPCGERNQEELDRLFGLLGVEFKIVMAPGRVPIATIMFKDTPFSMMESGSSDKIAKLNLIDDVFTFLDIHLG